MRRTFLKFTTRSFIVASMLTCSLLVGAPPSQDEALFVRRIAELWKAEEYDLAQRQMREFFEEYPKSAFRDRLMLIAADQEWRQEHYTEALSYYDQIESKEFLNQSFERRMDSLYHAKEYSRLVKELRGHLASESRGDLSPAESLRLFQYAEALSHIGRSEEALGVYRRLYETTLSSQAKLAAANVYVTLNQTKEAVELYLSLAETLPDKHEALILRAAQLQIAYDPKAANITLGKLQGNSSEGGTFSQVFLLFQSGHYQQLWDRRNALTQSVAPEQRPLLEFFLGRAAFTLGNYQEAIKKLKPLLSNDTLAIESAANEKTVLAILIVSAQRLDRPDWADAWIDRFQQKFPEDSTLARLWLGQAEALRECEKPAECLPYLERILASSSTADERQRAAYQRIGALYDLSRWRDAQQASEVFLAAFPSSPYLASVNKVMAQATARQLEDTALAIEEREFLQQRLAKEIDALLHIPKALTAQERATYLLQLAKVEYARKNFTAAVASAEQFLKDYPTHSEAYQAHLVLAYSHYEESNDPQPFLSHAQTALSLRPDLSDQDAIRLNLFATYVKLARIGREDSGEVSGNMELAADQLYAILTRGQTPLKAENLSWLAKYYYAHVRDGSDDLQIVPLSPSKRRDLAERALRVMLVAEKETPDSATRLEDLVMLSQLYGWLGLVDERLQLLQRISHQHWPDTAQTKSLLARTCLALALTYQEEGDTERASSTYEDLAKGKEGDSFVRDFATLQMARIHFDRLPEAQRTSDNPQVIAVLTALQNLQARRNVSSEPVHLEAAWDRAWMMSQLAQPDVRNEVWLTQLRQTKRDLTSQDDIVSKDYHAIRETSKDKDLIYQAYLMLFDARIAQLEGEAAAGRKRYSEQKSKQQAAKNLYGTLLRGNFAVSKYLVAQAQSGLDEMNTIN